MFMLVIAASAKTSQRSNYIQYMGQVGGYLASESPAYLKKNDKGAGNTPVFQFSDFRPAC